VTWTSRRAVPCCDIITGVAYGNGVFAAVGGNGSAYILTSPDGVTWTKAWPTTGSVSGYAAGIAYGPGKGFAAVGSFYNGTADQGFSMYSPDGVTWATSATAATDISSNIQHMTFGNGLWLATGFTLDAANPYGDGAIYTSTDGSQWTAQALNASFPIGDVAYGNSTYVALEPEGNAVWTSADAMQWTRTAITFTPGQGMPFGNGVFYNSALYTSPNGTNWTKVSPLPNVQEINGGAFWTAYYSNLWVGVNTNEAIITHH
jgi:hypothetical protein